MTKWKRRDGRSYQPKLHHVDPRQLNISFLLNIARKERDIERGRVCTETHSVPGLLQLQYLPFSRRNRLGKNLDLLAFQNISLDSE